MTPYTASPPSLSITKETSLGHQSLASLVALGEVREDAKFEARAASLVGYE